MKWKNCRYRHKLNCVYFEIDFLVGHDRSQNLDLLYFSYLNSSCLRRSGICPACCYCDGWSIRTFALQISAPVTVDWLLRSAILKVPTYWVDPRSVYPTVVLSNVCF
jgi:hypothetical protein